VGSAHVRIRRASGRLTARTIDDLAAFTVDSIGSAAVKELTVRIDRHRLPRGWVGAPQLHGLQAFSLTPEGDGVEVRITTETPKDISVLAAAVMRAVSPVRGPHGTFTSPLPATAAMLAPSVRDVFADDDHVHLRRADDVFGSVMIDGTRHIAPAADGHWQIDGRRQEVWVDPGVHRPFGRESETPVVIADAPTVPWLSSSDVAALRNVTAVRGSVSPVVTAQLHACGVLREDELPSGDILALQVASVQARRASYRRYSWPAALDAWPSVSVVMLTNRTTYLAAIIDILRSFNYPRLEVVIGLHGLRPPIINTEGLEATVLEIDASLPFGAAMQQACDVAGGELLTKVDDDDVYGPEHIWDLVIAKRYSGADIVGKALDWISLPDENTTVFRPVYAAEKYGKFVAGGTIMIDRAALAAVGGWRPVPRSIDRALLESVRACGGLVYRTHGLGYMYVRRSNGHTAQVDNAHFRTRASLVLEGSVAHPEFGTA